MERALISAINSITQFGLQADLILSNKSELLEKSLIKIYNLYFELEYVFDETDYPEFDKSEFLDIRENIISNFPKFGYYKTLDKTENILVGDAVDDLSDIVFDILEVNWRIENNSLDDGIWYFKFVFETHTKQHILDLLTYIN